jgi:hypothetical protein
MGGLCLYGNHYCYISGQSDTLKMSASPNNGMIIWATIYEALYTRHKRKLSGHIL